MIKLKHLYKYFLEKKINFFIFIPLYLSSFNILSDFVEKKIIGSFSIFGDFLIYRCAGINYLNKESPYGINKLQECLNSYPYSLDFFYTPITLNFFIWRTLNLQATQSATGLLYVSIVSILFGDLLFKYYLLQYGFLV